MFLHTVAIGEFGGSEGVRDLESLRAAVARPWGASFGRDHFPTAFDKAATLAGSLIRQHPFVDGNKRTAVYAAAYLLEKSGYGLEAQQRELEEFGVSIAVGKLETRDVARWLEKNTRLM